MSTYSPVDELTLSMKWAVNEMAVDESPPYRNTGLPNTDFKSGSVDLLH